METPVPFLLLALHGRADFVRRTSPFGGSPSGAAAPAAAKADPPPAAVASKIRALMTSFRKG